MEVKRSQVFNLWDTNGRRHDVINALEIYLRLLRELHDKCPSEQWGSYPNSTLQYRFYKAAIAASPDVFQDHSKFDQFENYLLGREQYFYNKTLQLSANEQDNLDKNIEQRARHYTSNLVRLGLADKERNLSPAGTALLSGKVSRDVIEELLPITDTNLILLRQLLKLKIYTTPCQQGVRYSYSPCLMAFYLLLTKANVDINFFKQHIQGVSPYWKEQINLDKSHDIDIANLILQETNIPSAFTNQEKISLDVFKSHIRNRKSSITVINTYYDFYSALYDYRAEPNEAHFITLQNILLGDDTDKITKAFGSGSYVLLCGTKTRPFSHEQFIESNSGANLIHGNVNTEFYKNYAVSKYLDTAREYADTTIRMLSATGVFQFSKPLVELSYKKVFQAIMSHINLRQLIFNEETLTQYTNAEVGNSSDFCKGLTLIDILRLDETTINSILLELQSSYGTIVDVRTALIEENRTKLEEHIRAKYPKKEIIRLLRLISDRRNDHIIKQYVNEDATVPTIYEFIVAIAWYYISNEQISVYDSLNLTLNGDFEPVIHASGGAGDIVVNYPDKTVMLEATLMNASSQKRGEWEPVLRHAINLTAEEFPQKVYTLFVADELDYNTINIWRAVAAVTLESSTTGEKTEHVIIMPFTNENICHFMESGVSDTKIITRIEQSFDEIKANFDDTWHSKILDSL